LSSFRESTPEEEGRDTGPGKYSIQEEDSGIGLAEESMKIPSE